MTKTVNQSHGIPKQKDIQDRKPDIDCDDSNGGHEPSDSPPLVLKYLESLPPEREVTLLVEVIQQPPPPQTKVLVQNNVVVNHKDAVPCEAGGHHHGGGVVVAQAPSVVPQSIPHPPIPNMEKGIFKKPKIICQVPSLMTIASVVKDLVKNEITEDDEEEDDDDEEEECLRIIEETIVDVSTLPGRSFFLSKY